MSWLQCLHPLSSCLGLTCLHCAEPAFSVEAQQTPDPWFKNSANGKIHFWNHLNLKSFALKKTCCGDSPLTPLRVPHVVLQSYGDPVRCLAFASESQRAPSWPLPLSPSHVPWHALSTQGCTEPFLQWLRSTRSQLQGFSTKIWAKCCNLVDIIELK